MGFTVKRKIYRLKFQDDDLAGLVVEARGLSLGKQLELTSARATWASGDAAAKVAAVEFMVEMLASALVSWDAEDEDTGQPIPRTAEGIKSQDASFYMAVIDAWAEAMTGVSAPLSETSSGTQPSVEASIPMDVPSAGLAS